MLRALASCLALLALAGCQMLPGSDRSESPRGPTSGSTISNNREARQCLAELGASGAGFSPLPDRYAGEGCTLLNTVDLNRLPGDNGAFSVSNLGPVTCPTATAFTAWVRYGVDRAARVYLGSPIVRIETMGSYACRNVAGTGRRSAHASAAAIAAGSACSTIGTKAPRPSASSCASCSAAPASASARCSDPNTTRRIVTTSTSSAAATADSAASGPDPGFRPSHRGGSAPRPQDAARRASPSCWRGGSRRCAG